MSARSSGARYLRPSPSRSTRFAIFASCCCLAALTGGCAGIQPDPLERDVPLPGEFTGADGRQLPEKWWLHFDDPRLTGVIQDALGGSFSLAAARARLRQARAEARVAGAARLPSLDATGSASTTSNDADDDGNDEDDAYTVGATASYEVDLWGRLESTAEAQRFEARASAAQLRAASITLSADTASTFYSLLRQRAVIDLLKRQRETNRQIAELIGVRYRNGQAELDELLRQRRLVESAASGLESARRRRDELRRSLAALTGQPPSQLELPAGHETIALPPLPKAGLPSAWLNRRPDLRAAWLQVRAADAELARAIASRYPRLDLSATVESVAEGPEALFTDWITNLAANLTVPLFRGEELTADAERARAARAVAFNDYAQTAVDAVAEVQTALTSARHDRRRLESLARQVELAERAVDQLRRRYLVGTGSYVDVLTSLTNLQDLQRQRLEARWTLIIDRITLIRTIATGWQASQRA